MTINNINIKNTNLNIKNQRIALKGNGIYLIKGDSGSGKTSILEYILFQDNLAIDFENEQEKNLYTSNKNSLFTYISQDVFNYKTSVGEFIKKGNKTIDKVQLNSLLLYFGLADITENDDYSKLSGGEKHKLSIISGILKGTQYIFLDEPTNHLDDNSVVRLCQYLQEYAKFHKVVIVSHDPRISFENAYNIRIKNNKIKQDECNGNDNNERMDNIKLFRFANWNFIKNIIWRVPNIISVYLIIILCMIIAIYNDAAYQEGYCDENDIIQEDTILAYDIGCTFEELNCYIAEAENIEVSKESYEKTISNDDIRNLKNIKGVKDVILCDNDKYYIRFMDIAEQKLKEEFYVFNTPKDIRISYSDTTGKTIEYFGSLLIGDYPEDYNNEICITKEIAINTYGTDVLEDVIGKTFNYENNEYSISGVLDNDYGICMVSYNAKDNYGFFGITDNLNDEMDISNILIITEKGTEKQVLKELIKTYPAENYVSSVYQELWKKQFNKEFILKQIFPMSCGISILFSIVVLLIKRTQMQTEISFLKDYSNYYITRKKSLGAYVVAYLIQIMIVIIVGISFNMIYSDYSNVNSGIILIDCIISIIPSIILAMRSMKKEW